AGPPGLEPAQLQPQLRRVLHQQGVPGGHPPPLVGADLEEAAGDQRRDIHRGRFERAGGMGRLAAAGDTLLVQDAAQLRLELRRLEAGRARLAAEHDQAREVLRQTRRELELAETTLTRTRRLQSQGSATEQQVDDLDARRDVTASKAKAAESRLEALSAQAEELEASVALQRSRIADAVVMAPRAGTILLRVAEPGEVGRPGQPALRLANLDSLELRVYLQEPDLDLVRLGEQLPVQVDALGDREVTGVVSWISPEAEFTPRNVQTRDARAQLVFAVELRLANPGNLHVGMPASVRLAQRQDRP
ncbi:MAG: efflux RND transporter periplasmic adaptor subunit, partial [Candidatus Krumholzibacteriia bacterium]